MKKKLFLFSIFLSLLTYSQVTVGIKDLKVNNTAQSIGVPIKFGTSSYVHVNFTVTLSKSGSFSIGNCYLYVRVQNNAGVQYDLITPIDVPSGTFQTSAASVIDKSTIAEVTLNKYKNTFETAYGAACTDPFHNALDDSAVSNTLASLNDAAGKLVASEASSYTEGRLQSARRLGVTPTLASQQSMNVVNNIVNGNAASRMASLRTQAESESNVKGATDFGSSDFWTTVKRSRTTVKNGQYADADVSVTNYQIGYDFRNAENSYLGVYLGMTAGNVKSNGYTTDIDQAYDFGIYGTRALHHGQYLNYLARFGVMSNKMEDSTWDTSDMGLSFEYGKKMQYGKDLFFTPYVRLDYDRVRTDAVTYASGNQVAADTANNVTGKLGFTLEKTFAAGNSLYFGSAYSHGLSGSSTTYFNQTALPAVDNDAKVVYVNIGTKQMLGDASYLDINYEKTFLDYDGWSLQAKYNLMF